MTLCSWGVGGLGLMNGVPLVSLPLELFFNVLSMALYLLESPVQYCQQLHL